MTPATSGKETTTVGSPVRRAANWWAFCALAALVVVLFWSTWRGLAIRWNVDGGYAHGWLLATVTGWILWDRGPIWAAESRGPSKLAIAFILAASVGWLAGAAMSIQVLEQLMALAVLASIPLAVFGFGAGLHFSAAIGLLIFAIPVWDGLTVVLQNMTVAVSGVCLHATGVTALIEGNFVTLPSGVFEIAAGCSGLNYFVAAGALASVYGFLWLHRWSHRVVMIVAAMAGSLVANWARVYGVILAGYLTDMQHFLVRVDHYWFGWGLFGLAMIPVFSIGGWLERREGWTGDSSPQTVTVSRVRVMTCSVVSVLALIVGPVLWHWVAHRSSGAEAALAQGPRPAGWAVDSGAVRQWRPRFVGASVNVAGALSKDGALVEWAVAGYPLQEQGREVVYYANRPADRAVWRLGDSVSSVSIDGRSVNQATLTPKHAAPSGTARQQRRLWWWYEIGGRAATTDLDAKLAQFAAAFRGRGDARFIGLSSACDPDCRSADQVIERFLNDSGSWGKGDNAEIYTESRQ